MLTACPSTLRILHADQPVSSVTGRSKVRLVAALSPCRQRYYSDAMQALADSDDPQQAAWPLLRTWLDVYLASNMTPPNSEIWKSCLETLGFSQESAEQKIEALDAYLDSLEIIIETWTDEYGI